MGKEITCSLFIEASVSQVWRAVESQEMIRKWLGSSVEFEPFLGGKVRIYGLDDEGTKYIMGGKVITWEPGRQLQFTWECFEPQPEPETLLTLDLRPDGNGTMVTLTHSRFDTDALYESFKEGWGEMRKSLEKIADIALSA